MGRGEATEPSLPDQDRGCSAYALKRLFPSLYTAAERWPDAMKVIWRLGCMSELSYQIATRFEVNGSLVRRPDFEPYFRHLGSMDPRLFLGMLKHASEHSAFDHLAAIDVPTLIVAGTNDTFTPYWLSEEMQDRIPNAEMLTVPGGTHVAPIEQPELIGLRLEKFLERVRAASAPPIDASEARQAAGAGVQQAC